MTDKWLMEFSAKSVGLAIDWHDDDKWASLACGLKEARGLGFYWSPLTDMNCAMYIALKLNFAVTISGHEVEVFSEDGEKCVSRAIGANEDKADEVCRAITTLAAEIGSELAA